MSFTLIKWARIWGEARTLYLYIHDNLEQKSNKIDANVFNGFLSIFSHFEYLLEISVGTEKVLWNDNISKKLLN